MPGTTQLNRGARWLLPLLLVAISLAPAAARGQQPAPAASDSARLQGTWRLLEGSADGHGLPPALRDAMRRTLEGNHLRVAAGAEVYLDATVRFHPATSPASIDYHWTTPSGTIQRGIYRWQADTIEFCFARVGQARPLAFTERGDGRTWTRWVRVR